MLSVVTREDGYGCFSVAVHPMAASTADPPELSVVLAIYNAEAHLRYCLESIQAQTFKDFECILLNDGSDDGSVELLRSICDSDSRFILVEQPNMGLTKSLNRGIALARGRYIARHDADDGSHPDRFQCQIQYLLKNPDVAVVGTGVRLVDEAGDVIRIKPAGVVSREAVQCVLQSRNCMVHGSVMCNKALLQEQLEYDDRFRFAQDYELFSRISELFPVENISEPLYDLRISSGSISSIKVEEQCYLSALVSCRNQEGSEMSVMTSLAHMRKQVRESVCLRKCMTRLLLMSERPDLAVQYYSRWHPLQAFFYVLSIFSLIPKLKFARRMLFAKCK